MSRGGRVKAERGGRQAETVAAALLVLKGYEILARRFETPGGEIDLVARKGGTIVFVEVKARRAIDAALFAVTRKTRLRIEAAARSFQTRHPRYAELGVRFDIVALAGWRFRHVRDAWREGDRD
jgi:putative endonuclease